MLRAVDQLNERSSEANLYRLLELDPLGSSVREIPQARILEWFAISFSRGSS